MNFFRKIFYFFLIFSFLLSCKSIYKTKDSAKIFITLKENDTLSKYIKGYFLLSEQRNLELWYGTYLNECTQFYKIQNPTKDIILNLIKSYWVTSDSQKHEIFKIETKNADKLKEVIVTMNYSYFHIPTNTAKMIEKLKLQLILNRRNKIISIKEFSRGT